MPVSSSPCTGVSEPFLTSIVGSPTGLPCASVTSMVASSAPARAPNASSRASAHVQRRRPVGPQVTVERLDLGLAERVVGQPHVALVDAHEIDVHAARLAAAARRRPRACSRSLSRMDETLSSPDSPRTTSMRGRSSSTRSTCSPPVTSDDSATCARSPGITTGGAAPGAVDDEPAQLDACRSRP